MTTITVGGITYVAINILAILAAAFPDSELARVVRVNESTRPAVIRLR
jgi:hypothetical protein